MILQRVVSLLVALLLTAVAPVAQTTRLVSIEGHRGARGHLPENTIPSFLRAIELGADTLELDVVISKDNKVVVSHEPWFSNIISLDPKGDRIPKERERDHNIFLIPYSEIRKYDVGSLGNVGFPTQRPLKAYKPLLSEVFAAIDKASRQRKWPAVLYNIEIKSGAEGDGKFHPAPEEFARLVLDTIHKHKMEGRVKVQSFDVRPLQAIRRFSPTIKVALLVGNKDGIEKSVERLGFKPDAYSPHFSLVDQGTVSFCRLKGIKLVPWTVNEMTDLEKMRGFDIDGIITDFPDRAVRVFRK